MISEGPNLIEALPAALQEALNGSVRPGETLRIAVRASAREALAATDRRLLILREPLPGTGAGVATTEIDFDEVSRASLNRESGSCRLRIEGEGGAELAALEVSVYEFPKFERVVERLNRFASGAQQGTAPAGVPEERRGCPKCAAAIPAEGAFCPNCRLQVADPCAGCGRALEQGWQFCAYCGQPALPHAVVPCPNCGELLGVMQAFCPDCGTQARPRCVGCGGIMMPDWDFCTTCGSETGAEAPGEPAALDEGAMGAPLGGAARPVSKADQEEAERLNEAGIAAYEEDRIDEAISLFQRALLRSPDVARYHANLGVACEEKKWDYEAYAAYRRALELDPNELQARLNLGTLYAERERYQQAREEWEKVIAATPESEEAQEARANLNSLDEL